MTNQPVQSSSVVQHTVIEHPTLKRPYIDWNIDGPKAALIFFLFLPLLLGALIWPSQLNQTFWQPMSFGAEDLVGSCIEGMVTDEAGNPLQNNWTILATPLDSVGNPIDAQAITVLSDLTGRFRFRRPLLPAGTWRFMIILLDEWMPASPEQIVLTLEDDQAGCRTLKFIVRPANPQDQSTQATSTPAATATRAPTRSVVAAAVSTVPSVATATQITFITSTPTAAKSATPRGSGAALLPTATVPVIEPTPTDDLQDDGRIEVSVLKIDESHRPLAGWIIRAEPAPDNVISGAIEAGTGQDGIALFRLEPGLWTFIEKAPGNVTFEPIVPDTDRQQLRIDPPGPYTIRFKNRITGPGCIDVYKYDLPPDNGQPFGLEGWQIALTRADGTPVNAGKTNALGQLRFDNLGFGEYIISEENRDGWTAVTPPSRAVEVSALDCLLITFFNKQTDDSDQEPTPAPTKTPNDSQECRACHTGTYPKPRKPIHQPNSSGYDNNPMYGGNDGYSGGYGASGCERTHVVRNGEWIYNIARYYGISAQSLYDANPWVYQQYNHFLYPGQLLCIPRW